MVDQKKFLDYEGVTHLWSKVNMQDYPNNDILMSVINAIDETKADKEDLVQFATEEYVNNSIIALAVKTSDYGMSPDNTDNSPALLDAISYAVQNGINTVYIPAGTYICTTPITLPDGVTIELVGAVDAFANSMNRELIGTENHTKEAGTTIIYRGDGAMFLHQSCVFKFKNLSLVSQDENKNYLYTSRLVGQTTVNSATKGKIYAEGCLFAGWKTVAGDPYVTDELEIALGGTLTKPEILEQCCIVASRCRFSFCGCAMNMGVDSRLDDCSINKCYYGASFFGAAGFSTISNSRIEWCLYDGIVAEQAHDIMITGCEFDRCGYAAIRYLGCSHSSIIGNTLRRNGADSSLTADAAIRNVHLYITNCIGGVICNNITVKKNISDDGTSTIVRPVNSYNIQLNTNMVISDNDFTGCTTGTYNRFTDNVDCRVIGNLLLNDVDIIPIPTTAAVGQTIVIKAVDENGKPTEWETIELPSIEGLATEEYVNTSIANLVDSAPDTLNTLNELATAIQANDSVINTLNAAITDKADKASLEETNTNINALQAQVSATSLILIDTVTGTKYAIQIRDGQVVFFPVEE